MHSWTETQSKKVNNNYKNKTKNIKHNGKKIVYSVYHIWNRWSRIISVLNKAGKQKFRPFSIFSGVNCRRYSITITESY